MFVLLVLCGEGGVVNGESEYLKITSFHIQRQSECQGNFNIVTPLQARGLGG